VALGDHPIPKLGA